MVCFKKVIIPCLAMLGVSSAIASRGDAVKPITPWIGAGWFSSAIPQPTDSGFLKTDEHYTLGLGAYYRVKVTPHWDIGPEVSYLYSSNTDLVLFCVRRLFS